MKCDQICKWNSNVGCVKPYGVSCILENVSPTDRKATNADRIRAMSDEELAEFLCGVFDEDECSGKYICGVTIADYDQFNIAEWLKQPADPQKGE